MLHLLAPSTALRVARPKPTYCTLFAATFALVLGCSDNDSKSTNAVGAGGAASAPPISTGGLTAAGGSNVGGKSSPPDSIAGTPGSQQPTSGGAHAGNSAAEAAGTAQAANGGSNSISNAAGAAGLAPIPNAGARATSAAGSPEAAGARSDSAGMAGALSAAAGSPQSAGAGSNTGGMAGAPRTAAVAGSLNVGSTDGRCPSQLPSGACEIGKGFTCQGWVYDFVSVSCSCYSGQWSCAM